MSTDLPGAWYYEKRLNDDWRADSASLAAGIDELYAPESVLDLGCAVGWHLQWFAERGRTVRGVELSEAAIERAVVDESVTERYDLAEPYRPGQTFDVVICIEVAEHLPEAAADTLADSIDRCAADAIVFSAATPDAQGQGHVNEQPRAYWREKFAERGRTLDGDALAALRERVSTRAKHWVPPRLFVFR